MSKHSFIRMLCVVSIAVLVLSQSTAAKVSAADAQGVDTGLPRFFARTGDSMAMPANSGDSAHSAPQASIQIATWETIVFQSYRDYNWEIYSNNSMDLAANLTNNGASDISPKCKPGCQLVAFSSNRSGYFQIYLMNQNGTGVFPLTYSPADNGSPDWSPDGKKIVFESYRDGQPEIYSMNADGFAQTRLTFDPDYDGMPAWSPDGSKIAFVSRRTGGYRIYTMNSNGSNVTQLSLEPYSENPRWSADGTQIAYDADGDGDGFQEIWTMNANGSSQHLFAKGNSAWCDLFASGWSPNGTWMVATGVYYIKQNGRLYVNYAEPLMWFANNPYGFTGVFPTSGLDFYPDWVSLDITAPQTEMDPLPLYSFHPVGVVYLGTDNGGSYIKDYDVQVRELPQDWTSLADHTPDTWYNFDGQPGHTYCFRARATDMAGNVESWPTGPGVQCTTLYQMSVQGVIQDNREVPIINASTTTIPAGFASFPSDADGRYAVYEANEGNYHITWSKNGYTSLPDTILWRRDTQLDVTLPPADNLIKNWGFETGDLSSWTVGGEFLPVISDFLPHSGSKICSLGNGGGGKMKKPQGSADSTLSQSISIPTDMNAPTLSFYYWMMGSGGESGPHFIVSVTSDGVTTTLWSTYDASFYGWRHAWFDLSQWSGKDITLTFNMQQGETIHLTMLLDEVTVGSAYSDVWVEIQNGQTALPGKPVTYQIIYGNRGSVPAKGVTITNLLPPGMTFVSASVPPVTTAPLAWDVGDLAKGSGPFTITVTAAVDPTTPLYSTLTHAASIASATPEVELLNNSAQAEIWIGARLYLPVIGR